MTFTRDDFRTLLQMLEENPEWRAELRRHVLSDELLTLPDLVRQLADAQRRTEEQVAALATRIDALADAQRRTEENLATLTARVDTLTSRVDILTIDVGELKGETLELRFPTRAPSHLSRIARRLRVLDTSTVADLLDDAVDAGQIDEVQRAAVLAADVVLTGQLREERTDAYLVVEVSWDIGMGDVFRALDRAAVMTKLGRPAVAVVAGTAITPDAAALATAQQVWQIIVERANPPQAA